jgi:hypothetical protein
MFSQSDTLSKQQQSPKLVKLCLREAARRSVSTTAVNPHAAQLRHLPK